MLEKVKQLLAETEKFATQSAEELEQFRIKMLGRKGEIKQLFAEFKNIPAEQKKEFGQQLNTLRNAAEQKIHDLKTAIENAQTVEHQLDLTMPAEPLTLGSRHPLSLMRNEIIDIFGRLGYSVFEGPEMEDDWHVFGALNFPKEHPARDMQDTFFIDNTAENEILLRTHTSSGQIRMMENNQPPIRIVVPGRVYRNEAVSARAHCMFHQVEGLYIDENVSFADLKQNLLFFAKEMFGKKSKIRLRPSYFPFTEPSAEMDVSCSLCGGKGCNVCKYTGWLEVLGCGMVDPNVLEYCNIDSKKYTGFAFGMGIERIAMLKYNVKDLRLYFENDMRFLKQFAAG